MSKSIILFDGYCNLCNSTVDFIIREDKNKIFQLFPFQSDEGQEIVKQYNLSDESLLTVILVENGKVYKRSTAILNIVAKFGFYWGLFSFTMKFFPVFIRDYVYNIISKNRSKWFGRSETCNIPNNKTKSN